MHFISTGLQCKTLRRQFLPFFIAAAPSFAQPYLRGTVTDAANGTPLDSVRVASSLYSAMSHTSNNGAFSLEPGNYSPCRSDTQFVDSVDVHTVDISIGNRPCRLISTEGPPMPIITLSNLSGRRIGRAALGMQQSAFFPGRSPAAGVYILEITGTKPARVLFTDRHRSGMLQRGKKTVRTLLLPNCPGEDTVYFCKDGFVPAVFPVKEQPAAIDIRLKRKRWIASDFHSHSVLTDGGELMDTVVRHAFGGGGLDLYVNSEHGGIFSADTLGRPILSDTGEQKNAPRPPNSSGVPRWYSLTNYSWPKIISLRKRYPDKILLQGVEWNVPGHEHASVGFINDADQPDAVADFEYRFDFNDNDASRTDMMKNNYAFAHDDALDGLSWLKKNYPASSYCFINHPSREAIGPYPVSAFRDFNNTAPAVCFGFEGMPGYQKSQVRASYGYTPSTRSRTWGGADYVLAQLGGIWDALLGEGRRFFIAVNSDFHYRSTAFFPGEYAKNWSIVTDTGAQAWLDGLRSGEMFIVHGDLINRLEFSIDDGICNTPMGAELRTRANELLVTIRFASPAANFCGTIPRVDHIDLISGAITGPVSPDDQVAYNDPTNASTRLAARFDVNDWTVENGYMVIRTKVSCTRPTYFRLRGANQAVGTPGEIDNMGNPLMDIDYENNATVACRDLWFYSNPIFVYIK